MSTLATIDQLKAFRSVSAGEEPAYQLMLDAAEEYINSQVGRPLASATYTRRLSGDGTPLLLLPHWPVTAVSALTVDTVSWSVMTEADAEAYQEAFLPDHGLYLEARGGGVWPKGQQNIVVSYTAGYSTIPNDLVQACIMIAVLLFIERGRIGDGAKTIGPQNLQTVVRDPGDYQFIRETISKYGCRL